MNRTAALVQKKTSLCVDHSPTIIIALFQYLQNDGWCLYQLNIFSGYLITMRSEFDVKQLAVHHMTFKAGFDCSNANLVISDNQGGQEKFALYT